ncbi:ATP-binding protein [Consotaella salsifontis]|uniref:histidine kinase n=1 Tax=Consotaella salsifontis TaxID=1365950 RepID=A0A1T4SVH9_9HYPH|nr:ATP-binding protein [Consotaella salsifontis]SKA31901.1 Signal transduction histidine kinase [Consotaella salsifontis]
MKNRSVSKTILIAHWLAVTFGAAITLAIVGYAWNSYYSADRAARLVEIDRLLFNAASEVRLRIGTIGVALMDEQDPKATVEGDLAFIAATNARLVEAMEQSFDDDGASVRQLAHADEKLRRLSVLVRQQEDAPRDERNLFAIEPWRMAIFDVAAAISSASTYTGHELRKIDARFSDLLALRQLAFAVRNRYARQCSDFRPNVVKNVPLNAKQKLRWRDDIGAYNELWTQLLTLATQLPQPGDFPALVRSGLGDTQKAQALISQTIAELDETGSTSIGVTEWFDNCVSAYAGILNIGRHALDLAVMTAGERRHEALVAGSVSTLFLIAALGFGVASLRFVRRRLTRPVETIETALKRFRVGDFTTPLTVPTHHDELGSIAATLEEFRHNTLEHERLRQRIDHMRDELVAQVERAGRVKSQFLATMSHEIRTPLHGILSTIQLLEKPASEEQQRLMLALERSGAILRDIINDILDFTRLESGRVTIENTVFCLRERIHMVEAAVASSLDQKGVGFSVSVDPALPDVVRGDAGKLAQVLLNLIGNAAKFTEKGQVSLAVEPATGRRDMIRFVVADTGIGIAPEALAHIFEPFAQADGSVARRFGGSGLGLAVCRGLLKAVGGDIQVETSVGDGTRFTVLFPLEAAKDSVAVVDEEGEELPPLDILVAEDNPVNALIARTLLEKDGHRVEIAEDGVEAVRAATTRDFDIILMDLSMPRLGGAAACRQIRANAHQVRNAVPILAVSAGGGDAGDISAGFDGWLEKPFQREDLIAAIAEAIGVRPRGPAREIGALGAIGEQARDLGVEGAHRLVDLYLSTQRVLFQEARLAGERRDIAALEALGHRMRGGARHVGADAIAEIAENIEQAASAGEEARLFDAVRRLVDQGEDLLAQWKREADRQLSQLETRMGRAPADRDS